MIRPALLVLCCVALTLGAEPDRDRVRLLSLGNSFSGCALQYLPQIAKAAGCRLEVTHLMIGGSSLEVHWKLSLIHISEPTRPY